MTTRPALRIPLHIPLGREDGTFAGIELPADLTTAEAERLGRVMAAFAREPLPEPEASE